ncbi:MAG: NAD-dependent epimerase/dehydratase family protein [Calditrichia bacterium]
MQILIIGGTRFLGYHLTRSLLDKGMQVTLFNRGVTPDDFGKRVDRIYGERRDYRRFYDTLHSRRFDAVIDLIGYEPQDVETAERTFHDRTGQYIFISTGQVYLVTENKHLPSREEDYHQPLIPCPPGEEAAYEYGIKKRQMEDYLQAAFRSRRFPCVRFRCPIIQGPRDYTLRFYSYLLRLADGHPLIIPEGGDAIIRHIFVEDVVNAILQVLGRENSRGKVYNLAQQPVLTLSRFIELAAGIMNTPAGTVTVPRRKLEENGIPGVISPFSGKWVSYIDPSLAREEIGFRDTPLEEWMPETIRWFMEEYEGEPPENFRFRTREIALIDSLSSKEPA